MKRSARACRESIRILVVDDDELTRDGLKAALTAEEGFVVQEAGDGLTALNYFKDDRPDVVLLDLRMPGMNGLETLRELRKLDDGAPVVIMTAYGDIPSAVEAMKSGAYDFIVKPPKVDQLIETLKRACEAGAVPGLGTEGAAGPQKPAQASALEKYKSLTEREREILKLTARGLDRSQIAELLSISPRTVDTHRQNLMEKLSLSNKIDLVRFAIRCGLFR
jgi:two-component system, NarL family, response regulator NreC